MKYFAIILLSSLYSYGAMGQTTHRLTVAINQPVECESALSLDAPVAVVHPNPATDWIRIRSLYVGDMISIYTLTGQEIYTEKASLNTDRLDVSNLSTGVYIVHVAHHDSLTKLKITIQRP